MSTDIHINCIADIVKRFTLTKTLANYQSEADTEFLPGEGAQ